MIDPTHLDPQYQHLYRGQNYIVAQAFHDFDGIAHPVGEAWQFVGTSFLPHDAGRSIFVTMNGKQEHIRMQDYPDAQGPILATFTEYVVAAPQ